MSVPPDAREGPAPGAAGTQHAVARAAAVVGAATLVSRVLGFVRDLVVARAFGAGPVTDAFFVAFRLPNLLRRIVAEGALAAAFVPVFTDYLASRSRAETLRMLRAVSGAMILLLGGLALAGVLGAPWIVRVMAPGFFVDPEVGALTERLTRLMFPYLFLVGLAALAMGVLNAHREFLVPALTPVALNLGIILAVLVLAPRLSVPVFALAVGVLVGGAGQVLVQIPALAARGVLVKPTFEPRHPAVRRIVKLVTPVVLGQSATHVGILINTVIASFLAGGSVSYLYYADRLMEFPQGVFTIAIATAALPTLSEQAARGETRALRETLSFALRLAVFVSLPAAVGLFVLREPLVRVLYQRGHFGPAETAGTAAAVGMYALGLVGSAVAKIAVQAFYALGDTKTPVLISIVAVAVNTLLASVLAGSLGHAGLALATSTAATVNALSLAWLLRRRLGGGPIPGGRRAWARTGLAALALAGGLVLLVAWWPAPTERLAETAWLGVTVAASVLAYAGLHAALGGEEPRLAWALGVRLLRRTFLRRTAAR